MAVSAANSSLPPALHAPDTRSALSSCQRPSLPVDVRAAALADVPLLIAMKTQMAAAEDAAFFFDNTPAHWERDLFGPEPRFLAFIAELAGHPVGMAIFNEQPMAGWPSVPIYIQSIYVKPEFRRRGVGRALMVGIIAEAQRRRSQLVFLNVDHNNAARRLYESGGFVHADTCLVYTLVVPQDPGTPESAPARK